MAIKIAIYNHKGGVGKTILTTNIAAALTKKGQKVLLVDSDPQANVTCYFLEESYVDDLLDNSHLPDGSTLFSVVKPVLDGNGDFNKVDPIETHINDLWIVPGDIKLAEFEEELNQYWIQSSQRKSVGYKGMTAISRYVNFVCEKYEIDYVFYDTGPNIGGLNRAILLDCDYFIVPAASDLFSRRALKTLGYKMFEWIMDWRVIMSLAPKDTLLLNGIPILLGYIPQRFKIWGGVVTELAGSNIRQIEIALQQNVIEVLKEIPFYPKISSMSNLKLGEVRDFTSLVEKGQNSGLPLWEVSGSPTIKEDAKNAFKEIAEKILKNT